MGANHESRRTIFLIIGSRTIIIANHGKDPRTSLKRTGTNSAEYEIQFLLSWMFFYIVHSCVCKLFFQVCTIFEGGTPLESGWRCSTILLALEITLLGHLLGSNPGFWRYFCSIFTLYNFSMFLKSFALMLFLDSIFIANWHSSWSQTAARTECKIYRNSRKSRMATFNTD